MKSKSNQCTSENKFHHFSLYYLELNVDKIFMNYSDLDAFSRRKMFENWIVLFLLLVWIL